MEDAVGFGAGTVDGLLLSGVRRGFGAGFDFAAAAQAPEGAADLPGEGFFDGAGGAKLGVEGFVEGGPDGLFVREDEIASGEEAGFDGVLGGGRLAFVGAGTRGALGVGLVRGEFCWGGGHDRILFWFENTGGVKGF
jgi:hypothetical protein